MGLRSYKILLQMAVCDMARCSGSYREKLLMAWANYIYKFNWDELEGMLLSEDMAVFQTLKKCMFHDLHDAIQSQRALIYKQLRNSPIPLSEEDISKYANAEAAIRSMSVPHTKRAVVAIVEFYAAVVATVDHKAAFPSQNID